MGGNIGIQRDKLGSPDSDLAQDLDQLADLDQDEFDGPLGTVNGKYLLFFFLLNIIFLDESLEENFYSLFCFIRVF